MLTYVTWAVLLLAGTGDLAARTVPWLPGVGSRGRAEDLSRFDVLAVQSPSFVSTDPSDEPPWDSWCGQPPGMAGLHPLPFSRVVLRLGEAAWLYSALRGCGDGAARPDQGSGDSVPPSVLPFLPTTDAWPLTRPCTAQNRPRAVW